MTQTRNVIVDELVRDAYQRGRVQIEVKPGDIVTAQARDTAERLKIKLLEQPLERPFPHKTNGTAAQQRILYRRNPGWQAPIQQSSQLARKISKLAIIGVGGVGAHLAHLATMKEIAHEIALNDVLPGSAEATALDLQHSSGVTRSATRLIGSTSIRLVESSDIIVVTAGRPRTPGMTRADLKTVNARIIRTVGESIANIAPNSVVIVVTNPVDEMTNVMLNATGFARERIIGMAGTLDSARFRSALSQAAGVPIADVSAFTLGSHGDEMVPIASRATIRGLPLSEFLNEETIEACRQRTIASGAEVVALRKTGSATFAPAHAVLELIEHMRGATAGAVPASVRLNGEYGIEGVVAGVPCKLCMSGVAEIVEIPLADEELNALMNAAEAVQSRLDSN